MLLTEILEKSSPNIRTSKKPVLDILGHKTHEVLGVGGQAIAYLHKKFPGKVIKPIQITGPDDPQYQFTRLCLKHQDNPYFPKIYAVKMYPTKEVNWREREDKFSRTSDKDRVLGQEAPYQMEYTLYVVTERLQHMTTVSEKTIEEMGFDIPTATISQDEWHRYKTRERVIEHRFRSMFHDHITRRNLLKTVRDPKLKQALRLLEPLFRNFEADMHFGNIMLRGKQWVITDPITYPY